MAETVQRLGRLGLQILRRAEPRKRPDDWGSRTPSGRYAAPLAMRSTHERPLARPPQVRHATPRQSPRRPQLAGPVAGHPSAGSTGRIRRPLLSWAPGPGRSPPSSLEVAPPHVRRRRQRVPARLLPGPAAEVPDARRRRGRRQEADGHAGRARHHPGRLRPVRAAADALRPGRPGRGHRPVRPAARPGGEFRQLTTAPWLYRRLYRRYFREVSFRLVVWNLPPGGVYYCRGWIPPESGPPGSRPGALVGESSSGDNRLTAPPRDCHAPPGPPARRPGCPPDRLQQVRPPGRYGDRHHRRARQGKGVRPGPAHGPPEGHHPGEAPPGPGDDPRDGRGRPGRRTDLARRPQGSRLRPARRHPAGPPDQHPRDRRPRPARTQGQGQEGHHRPRTEDPGGRAQGLQAGGPRAHGQRHRHGRAGGASRRPRPSPGSAPTGPRRSGRPPTGRSNGSSRSRRGRSSST